MLRMRASAGARALLRALHARLLGVCCASLAYGWFEGLYFFFSMPGPSPGKMRSDLGSTFAS